MFKSILIPLDGSPQSEWALPVAAGMAERLGASLHLATVHPLETARVHATRTTDITWRALEDPALLYLHRVADRLPSGPAGTATSAVLLGTPTETLVRYADTHAVDLIVMATHGRGPLKRFWLGSVADGVVRYSRIPVLLVRPGHEGAPESAAHREFRHILVPLDGSHASESVLAPAAAIASAMDAQITLLRVKLPNVHLLGVDAAHAEHEGDEEEDTGRWVMEADLERIGESLRHGVSQVQCKVLEANSVAMTILDYAEQEGVDLIAMTTHGRGGVRRLLLGSVADKVVRGAHAPVLVMRPPRR